MKTVCNFFTAANTFFLLPLLIVTAVSASQPELRLKQAHAQQTLAQFTLLDFKFDTLKTSGTSRSTVLQPVFKSGLALDAAGAPHLPRAVFILGVPQGARANATAQPLRVEELYDIDLAPVATYKDSLFHYTRDEKIYAQDRFYPQEIVVVESPSQFRDQTIVRVEIAPLQYNPVTRVLRIIHEMQITVNHAGAVANAPVSLETSPVEESLYRDLLLNYESAKPMRARREAKLSKSSSPFADGPLYKFPVTKEGLFRITGQTLEGKGISLSNINPANIKLYNNGGRELPRRLSAPRPSEILENAIYVADGGDGRFDRNDFILFYGRGVDGFVYDSTNGNSSHYINHFGFNNYYYLAVNPTNATTPGKRMNVRATVPVANATTTATTFREQVFVEEESNVWLESDQTWFGFLFSNSQGGNKRTYTVPMIDPVVESIAAFKFQVYAPVVSGLFGTAHRVRLAFNDQPKGEFAIFGNDYDTQYYEDSFAGPLKNGDNKIVVEYEGESTLASLYMDFLELRYDRNLKLANNILLFDGVKGTSPAAYALDNAAAQGLWLFDVSDFSNVAQLSAQNWQSNGAQTTFAEATHPTVPKRYLAATSAAFTDIEASKIELDAPSNLHASANEADMVIITHEDFVSQAQRIKSLRENWRPAGSAQSMKVEVVNIQDVFDEFSSGMYDPVAIRDFLKYAYENWARRPSFVLLFGDGDYDPKNIIVKTDKNWIPSFHTDDLHSIDSHESRVTDSWFTYLAGGDNDIKMDLAIGRIPSRSLADAEAYVDKLIKYETAPAFGAWRNTVIMVADDELYTGGVPNGETIHTSDTERLAQNFTPRYFDVKKLYLMEYAAVQSASVSGVKKPTATEALLRLLNNGSLIVNYTGHGNPTVWAHERVLELSEDFDRIQNGDRQAVWIAATCTFGKFDDPDRQSFAEQLVMVPKRGAIAALATVRDVFSTSNAALNQAYYQSVFLSDQSSQYLGTAMVNARARTNNQVNDEKFHLYGDPSMRLGMPRYSAQIVSSDTIKALALTKVKGTITLNGRPAPNLTGKVRVEAFDTRRDVQYRANNVGVDYALPGNSLFRGEAPVVNGQFEVQFIAPKDLTYGGKEGRFTTYFWNDTTDGNGYRERVAISGSATSFVDKEGPQIDIGFAHVEDFVTGGYVGAKPILHVTMFDSISGINLAGEIGHKITLTLDGNSGNKIDVTEFFAYKSGSYTRGELFYTFAELEEGRHIVEVKAWDNFNNSGTASAEFVIATGEDLRLSAVMNYPNPLRNETTFTFAVNQPSATVAIKIYTLSGRLLRTLEAVEAIAGFNMVKWDGLDGDGDRLANGVYLYKLIARRESSEGNGASQAEEIGKLVVQR
ncbi:MAG: type IX secretion system sortase PorU [candidate division KSB1 bacterium]